MIWRTAAIAGGAAIALAFARFSYALILPEMQKQLALDYATAGLLNTVNAIGYLAGALATGSLAGRFGEKFLFKISFLVTAISIGATGLSPDLNLILFFRALSGVAGASCMISGAALVIRDAKRIDARFVTKVTGLYFAAPGAGIAISAFVIPWLVDGFGWQAGWYGLSAISLVLAVPAFFVIDTFDATAHDRQASSVALTRKLRRLLLAYGLFGAGYIGYMTFIIAYLRGAGYLSTAFVSWFWVALGLAAVATAGLWSRYFARTSSGKRVAVPLAMVCLGTILALAVTDHATLLLSAIVFGGSFLAVVAGVANALESEVTSQAYSKALGTLTAAFSAGQIVGPLMTGVVSDRSAGLTHGLWLSAMLLLAGSLIAWSHDWDRQRDGAAW
ncbi:YbfB/YjiJ family MFS transporter [Erythrobacter aureus]|uniref:YbfB/YjiJ family MFS transporter n=1 Tax=Erythrobacter aureus TaxID=2182384 RepID=UPI001F3F6852|nr:YbfB/YjiJ family MFS transporter [Erythrobacter aureus]